MADKVKARAKRRNSSRRPVVFTQNFNFSPATLQGRVTIAYKAGVEYWNCTRECVEQARQKGVLRDG